MGVDDEAGFTPTDFNDGAGSFVAKDARGRDEAVMDFFYVSGTDTADGDFDEKLIWTYGRDRDGLEAQVVRAAINDGAHGFRDIEHRKYLNGMKRKGTKI